MAAKEIYTLQAEAFYPLQLLQISNISFSPPAQSISTFTPQYSTRLPLIGISYQNSQFRMPKLGIFTPFLRVHQWDGTTGRLELELNQDTICTSKLHELQSSCIEYLQYHPEITQSKEETPIRFQPFLSSNILTVFLNCSDTSTLKSYMYVPSENTWKHIQSNTSFLKGQEVRLAIRCQGLLCIPIQGGGTRFRLQHTIPAIYPRYPQE